MPSEELLKAAKNNEFQTLSRHLELEKDEDVNTKDGDQWSLLHYAAINGNVDMVKILLKNGANLTQVTNDGDTPMHIACRKGSTEIVNVLLKHASVCGINYIATETTLHGDTPLHIAAKNGFTDIVKTLLSHGAIYNITNKDNLTPAQLSKAYTVTKILNLIEESFDKAGKGDIDIINILKNANLEEFTAIMKARNSRNQPLIHEAMTNHHHKLTAKLLEMSVDIDSHLNDVDEPLITINPLPESTTSSINPKEKLKLLKSAAETHLKCSDIYLPTLRSMAKPYGSDKNPSPWKTLKEGTYLLGYTQALMDSYKKYTPGKIEFDDMKLVNDTLVYLQFDRSHISYGYTSEAYDGEVECFVSKGQGTVYYDMLHSDLNEDVRLFIDIVEKNLNTPVRRFLETVNQKLKVYS